MPRKIKDIKTDRAYLVDIRRRLAWNLNDILELRDTDIAFILGINRSSVSRILHAKKPKDILVKTIKKISK